MLENQMSMTQTGQMSGSLSFSMTMSKEDKCCQLSGQRRRRLRRSSRSRRRSRPSSAASRRRDQSLDHHSGFIHLWNLEAFIRSPDVSQKISITCSGLVDGRELTPKTTEMYFEDFQKYFKWDMQIDRAVRMVWEVEARCQYSNTLAKWKKR